MGVQNNAQLPGVSAADTAMYRKVCLRRTLYATLLTMVVGLSTIFKRLCPGMG